MPHSVFVVDTVARVARSLNKTDRRSYEAAIANLKGQGCRGAGYRLADMAGDDFPLCCRHLANHWRLHTVFLEDRRVIVVSLAKHTKTENAHMVLAEIFQGLSPVGRRRRTKPPCCDDPERPPVISAELRDDLARLFGYA